jgi:hypothetical protein
MRCIAALVLLFAGVAHAETVEGLWGRGFHGVSWGASIERARQLHPGGVTCPPMEDGSTVYNILFRQDPLGMGIRDVTVAFVFDGHDRLRRVLVRYPYSSRDDVLYRVAELLGQDYESEGDARSTRHLWNPRRDLNAIVLISDRPLQRAYFQVGAERWIERLIPRAHL